MSPENEKRLIAKLHWSEPLGQFWGFITAPEIIHLHEKHRVKFTSENVVKDARRHAQLGSGMSHHVYFKLPKRSPLIQEIQKRAR